ncbi:TPA: helix-turn-helix transcriptional regulator [Pasteurella multocida]|nr:helix-turn-helix transcriptional regulator [Pasteurella multocida]HDR1014619.1 helix-turn-helix transcriptional regulator [Pasteurella multocida]HDR1017026.1 helix-turn-helix transcriptional regulator [Pasteurella multocida]HDR1125608.1 helix-turn-helix transcriptional regulator [Pasteurella multocida]HDR1208663.1 helix-turn-helix transcriptional regulator [Pasteurella multocida]
MKRTNFGEFIRGYRRANQILLKQMADALGFSSAFLSSIENGNKPIPQGIEQKLVNSFSFSDQDKERLFESVDTTRTQSTITIPQNSLDQMIVGAFCRNFNELDDTKKQELLNLLKGVK